MKIVRPSWKILQLSPEALEIIELAGRTCYKSEDKIGAKCSECGTMMPKIQFQSHDGIVDEGWEQVCDCEGSKLIFTSHEFAKMILGRGHESVIEHGFVTVRFISNRGFTHEMVRHRLVSYSQESTRYCNYSGDKFGSEITVIEPWWFKSQKHAIVEPSGSWEPYDFVDVDKMPAVGMWTNAIAAAELAYNKLISAGLPAQAARGVLPIDVKTEIVVTANFREWRHIFKMRASPAAHPDMQRLMYPLLAEFKRKIPVIFDDLPEKDAPHAWDIYPKPE